MIEYTITSTISAQTGVDRTEINVSIETPSHIGTSQSLPASYIPRSSHHSLPLLPIPSLSSPLAPSLSSNSASSYSGTITTDVTPIFSSLQGNVTKISVMQSTNLGLKPIPPAATQVGDPNGHHEITEPNFTATKSCRGCSPVIEITATGWAETTPAQQQGTIDAVPENVTGESLQATILVGLSNIFVSQQPTGGNFVIDGSRTLTPGQTIIVDDSPVAIQTSDGGIELVVDTTVIQLQPNQRGSQCTETPKITNALVPLPPVLMIGTRIITADAQSQYIIADQTLTPGGPAIVISGTTLSLAPSAAALFVNGETSSLAPLLGGIYTTLALVELTLNDNIYTANRAGLIVVGPHATLVPGGPAVTVDGTTLSLEPSGTAVVVQGTTRTLQPITTIVTVTRAPRSGAAGSVVIQSTGYEYAYPTEKPVPGSAAKSGLTVVDGWLGGLLVLVWWGSGFFAMRL